MNISDLVTITTPNGVPVNDCSVSVFVKSLGVFEAFFFMLLILFVASFVHEYVHLLVLRNKLKREVEGKIKLSKYGFWFEAGTEQDYVDLKTNDRIEVYIYGILAGLFVVLLASIIHSFYLLALAPYIVGCQHDLKLIWQQVKVKQ